MINYKSIYMKKRVFKDDSIVQGATVNHVPGVFSGEHIYRHVCICLS